MHLNVSNLPGLLLKLLGASKYRAAKAGHISEKGIGGKITGASEGLKLR